MQCPGVRKGFLAAVEDLYMGCAGGVTVSFFEWVQNLQNFRWEEEEVNKRLDLKMTEAFAQIWRSAARRSCPSGRPPLSKRSKASPAPTYTVRPGFSVTRLLCYQMTHLSALMPPIMPLGRRCHEYCTHCMYPARQPFLLPWRSPCFDVCIPHCLY